MAARKKHRHTLRCVTVRGGRIVCDVTGAMYQPRQLKLTRGQKACAKSFVREELHDMKRRGRWRSPGQAIAVGLSRARRKCR
jgi:hypothetical protein